MGNIKPLKNKSENQVLYRRYNIAAYDKYHQRFYLSKNREEEKDAEKGGNCFNLHDVLINDYTIVDVRWRMF